MIAFLVTSAFPAPAAARTYEKYVVKEQGGFGSTGRVVELPDRYGWQSYELVFDFDVDTDAQKLKPYSRLELTIHKLDGGSWSYLCKESRGDFIVNINQLYGKGMSVVAQCAIKPKKFARAVGLDTDMVGKPYVVFQVFVQDGQATPGSQKGMYFLTAGQIEGSEMGQYSTPVPDPTNLGVSFNPEAFPTQPRR